MTFPKDERLYHLYEVFADALTHRGVEAILRRAGEEPTGQEARDVRHRIAQLATGSARRKQEKTQTDAEDALQELTDQAQELGLGYE